MPEWTPGQAVVAGDRLYIPFHEALVAAGPFLRPSHDAINSYLEVGPGVNLGVRDRYLHGDRIGRQHLFAAQVHGESMIEYNIHHGDICIFEVVDYVRRGQIMLVEKAGEEEGEGSWAIKRVVIDQSRKLVRDDMDQETIVNDQTIELRSYNPKLKPWLLDPAGLYCIRGLYLRVCNARLVDSGVVEARSRKRQELSG